MMGYWKRNVTMTATLTELQPGTQAFCIVTASKRQGRMKCQENRDRRKYQAKPEDTLVNLVNCKRIKKGDLIKHVAT